MDSIFTQTNDEQKLENIKDGINATVNHLNQSLCNEPPKKKSQIKRTREEFESGIIQNHNNSTVTSCHGNHNHNNNNSTIHDQSSLLQPKQLNFSNISNISQNNMNNMNNADVIHQLNENMKIITKINENIIKIPSLDIADELSDKSLIDHLNEYKKVYKNLYELQCIKYKIKLHLNLGFIPKNERFKINLNQRLIENKNLYNYNYVTTTLSNSAKTSKLNYKNKYGEKCKKHKHCFEVMKIINNEINLKIKDKLNNLMTNKMKYASQIIKDAIYNKFQAEVNKLELIKTEINERYNDDFDKFKNKLIIQFSKFCTKIKTQIKDDDYKFSEYLEKALRQKELNKSKIYNDQIDEQKLNDQMNVDRPKMIEFVIDGIMFNENMYNPNNLILGELNYVNISNKQRKFIVNNFGNINDKYLQKIHEKSLNKNNYKNHKNSKNSYYKNKNFYRHYKNKNNYYNNRKYNKYNHYKQDF